LSSKLHRDRAGSAIVHAVPPLGQHIEVDANHRAELVRFVDGGRAFHVDGVDLAVHQALDAGPRASCPGRPACAARPQVRNLDEVDVVEAEACEAQSPLEASQRHAACDAAPPRIPSDLLVDEGGQGHPQALELLRVADARVRPHEDGLPLVDPRQPDEPGGRTLSARGQRQQAAALPD
jgi:hypothetical protein